MEKIVSKEKIASLFVIGLLVIGGLGAIAMEINREKLDSETINYGHTSNERNDYTHTVFVEVGTSQNCKPCHYWNQNIHDAYVSGDYDFEYVEMIIYDHDGDDINKEANNWADNYSVGAIPNSIFDGDYKRIIGNYPVLLPNALNDCGNRAVADITADMIVSWLGDATIQVDITIENNEDTINLNLRDGIRLDSSDDNLIRSNTINENDIGLHLIDSRNHRYLLIHKNHLCMVLDLYLNC